MCFLGSSRGSIEHLHMMSWHSNSLATATGLTNDLYHELCWCLDEVKLFRSCR